MRIILPVRSFSQTRPSCPSRSFRKPDATIYFLRRAYSAKTSSSNFSYRISASFSAKQNPLDFTRNLYFHDPVPGSSSVAPGTTSLSAQKRKQKRYKSGQDAFFVSTVPENSSIAFGVLDGVGGWTESGIDPADFSHGLSERMGEYSSSYTTAVAGKLQREKLLSPKPLDILQYGYDAVQKDRTINAGGSTACIGVATKTGSLNVANLGDSGYAHLSPLRICHLSTPQTHAFNTPYQLSKIPPWMKQQIRLFGNEPFAETPAKSETSTHNLSHGDVFVFATDGLWDNLSGDEVLRIISGVMLRSGAWRVDTEGAVSVSDEGLAASILERAPGADELGEGVLDLSTMLAMAILREAKECSLNKRRDGPFAKEAKKAYPMEDWGGGKPDDICAVVGVVVQEDSVS
ncbi:protein serine/threonine phosphatase 2C [Microthyrium microscopicum]|uniref:Protein phosphatase n=1 Tax=Microthyrium microscopicum TaxID=703497 RepID=A0A6A6UU76_9PEZI|nr:protein serine/threonine phosphatase 2C [Microthyrium microscopicum]